MYIVDIHPKYQQERPLFSSVTSCLAHRPWTCPSTVSACLDLCNMERVFNKHSKGVCSLAPFPVSVHLPLFLFLFCSPCFCSAAPVSVPQPLSLPWSGPPAHTSAASAGPFRSPVPRYSPQPCSTCQSNFDHLVCLVRNGSNLWHCI